MDSIFEKTMQGIKITKQTPIFIYGGGEQGNIVANKLRSQGYYLFAGLDKYRCGKDVINDIVTYKFGTEPDFLEKKEGVVVICLANGLLHKYVADKLYESGYRYIIFLPIEHELCFKDKVELIQKYNNFINPMKLQEENDLIYEYKKYKMFNFDCSKAILEEGESSFTVFVNLEILYSVSYDSCEGDKTKVLSKPEYRDINISIHPYVDLYTFFDSRSNSLDRYFSTLTLKRDEDEKQKEVIEREKLYRIFKKELQKGLDFFISSAPLVRMYHRGRFNLTQGHHRTLFLLNERHTVFPVKMRIGDFKTWCNNNVYQELKEWILKKGIEMTYAPIPHPGMIDFPAKHECFGETRLQNVLNIIGDVGGQTILEYGPTEGYFSRIFVRAGVINATYMYNDKVMLHTAQILCRLLYVSHVTFQNNLSDKQLYDIVVVVEEEDETVDWKEFGKLAKTICILETRKPINQVFNEIPETKFSNIDILFQEYYMGRMLYMYILSM